MKAISIAMAVALGASALSYGNAEEVPPAMTAPMQKLSVLPAGLRTPISLDLRKIDIHDALKYFALKSGINIVTTRAVEGRVSLVVDNVPAQDVFDIMLRANGLAYQRQNDVYNVMTQAEYKSLYGTSFADIRQVRMFRLQYAIPDQAFSLLDALKSEIGRILVDPESGTVLCLDTPLNLEKMAAALVEYEKQNTSRIIVLNYAKAADVEAQLKKQLDEKKVGQVHADERGNQLVVRAFPERMKEIEELIVSLDRKTKEVLIDAKIVRVKLSKGSDWSVGWEGLFEVKGDERKLQYIGSYPFSSVAPTTADWRSREAVWQQTGNVGSYPFSGTTSNFSASRPVVGFENMHVGVVGPQDFDAVFTYITTQNDAKILSNPKLAVTNNQESRIHVGEKQAYVTTTTTTGQSNSTVSEQVTFLDVGIQMSVTPTINDDDFILMKLKTEVSSVVSILRTPSGNAIPIVDTSLAETTVLVKAASTLIIGGLRKDEKGKVVKRVPILSAIPILGKLFESRQETSSRTELLIMITPKIISGEALEDVQTQDIGRPDIKPMQSYSAVERRQGELATYAPAPLEDPDAMPMKGFKLYRRQAEAEGMDIKP
ncbi:MAG: secretin and TonB N-terminal domain-containing protein [Candidatus Omnitrophica bacterium]|nr:secretin and TonB N-terminal domain-containing protein [Candidatus Omnitrophota bacterium]